MKYVCTLLAVRDMERSKAFYREVLGLEVVSDLGANVTLTGGLALQTMDTWQNFIETDQVRLEGRACEVYFEEEDMDGFAEKLKALPVRYVHPLKKHSWGQRVVRLYDPDGHILEIGEAMPTVVRRFLAQGMTLEEVARWMDVPREYLMA